MVATAEQLKQDAMAKWAREDAAIAAKYPKRKKQKPSGARKRAKRKRKRLEASKKKSVPVSKKTWLELAYMERGYPPEWTPLLRKTVRERDGNRCGVCGKTNEEERRDISNKFPALSIHHIDEDKSNCTLGNLITLCNDCHETCGHGFHGARKWLMVELRMLIVDREELDTPEFAEFCDVVSEPRFAFVEPRILVFSSVDNLCENYGATDLPY